MKKDGKVYHVFYSKDVRKKKKVYSEGILLCEEKKTKLFNAEGQPVLTLNSRSTPQPDEEYTINNAYVVLVDKEASFESFQSGRIFMAPQPLPMKQVKKQKKKSQSLHKIEYQIAKEFPSGLKIQSFIFPNLREHQVQGVNFMYQCITGRRGARIEGCILADFMGLGKTLQTLTLIRCLLISKIVFKVVVVCPLTLIKIWQKECLKWMGSKLNPLVTFGSPDEIIKVFRMFLEYEYRFLVTSYQQFYKYSDKLSSKCDLLIFDEGHRLKNKKSKMFKKICLFKCKKRILLTGTPIQNNLDELYTCIMLVNPAFFQSQLVFKNVFHKPILAGMAKWASKEHKDLARIRTAELANLIKQFSLRRKADVLEGYLPKKRQYQVFLKLTPLQLTLYQRIMQRKILDTEVLSYLNQMRKLFTHPLLFKTDRFDNYQWQQCHEDCREEISFKMDFVLRLAQQCKQQNQKLVIVSYFTETLDFINSILQQQQISTSKLDGRLDGQQRFKAIQNFIRFTTVLLLSGKAGGTGLTLTCASKMIMIEPDWNPSNDSQVMGRIWRQGQTKQVQIFRLMIGCSFQEKILQRQQLKQNLSEKLIDEQKNTTSYDFFSMKQLFMEITPKCITYAPSQNRLEECRQKNVWSNWEDCVFVKVIESHQQVNKALRNQFEEAQFEEVQTNSEQKQQEEDLNQDDDLGYLQLRQQFQEVKSQPTKISKLDLSPKIKESQNQNNSNSNPIECRKEEKKVIPLALRKFKKGTYS